MQRRVDGRHRRAWTLTENRIENGIERLDRQVVGMRRAQEASSVNAMGRRRRGQARSSPLDVDVDAGTRLHEHTQALQLRDACESPS